MAAYPPRPSDLRVVLRDYRVAYPNPIAFVGGEEFAVGDEDTEYPGWLWVTTADGNAGWAPVQLIERLAQGRGRGRMDYTAQELDISAGDTVEVLSALNDWLWVRSPLGLEGWVPAEHVARPPPGPSRPSSRWPTGDQPDRPSA